MLKQIKRMWRIFATGLAFSFFGLGGLIITFFYIPIVNLIYKQRMQRQYKTRTAVSTGFKMFMRFMHILNLIDYRIYNKDVSKFDKGCLVIANHPTLIDVVAIISLYPNSCCVVKQKLWSNIFVKHVVQGAGYIPNNDATIMMSRCKEAIANNEVLIIFPEGTRTNPNEEIVMQRGAAQMAMALECPIRCINIKCNPITLYKGLKWYQVPNSRVLFEIEFKEKIKIEDHVLKEDPRPIAARKLTRIFKSNIAT